MATREVNKRSNRDKATRHLVHALPHLDLHQVAEALTAYAGILRTADRQFPDHEQRATADAVDVLAKLVRDANAAREFIEQEARAVFLTTAERQYLATLVSEDGSAKAVGHPSNLLAVSTVAKLQD